jgi:hypothetical protein
MTDADQDLPPCVLYGEPSIEAVPMLEGADGSPRPGVPLDFHCRQQWIAEEKIVGWCAAGSHYGRRSTRCTVPRFAVRPPVALIPPSGPTQKNSHHRARRSPDSDSRPGRGRRRPPIFRGTTGGPGPGAGALPPSPGRTLPLGVPPSPRASQMKPSWPPVAGGLASSELGTLTDRSASRAAGGRRRRAADVASAARSSSVPGPRPTWSWWSRPGGISQ